MIDDRRQIDDKYIIDRESSIISYVKHSVKGFTYTVFSNPLASYEVCSRINHTFQMRI